MSARSSLLFLFAGRWHFPLLGMRKGPPVEPRTPSLRPRFRSALLPRREPSDHAQDQDLGDQRHEEQEDQGLDAIAVVVAGRRRGQQRWLVAEGDALLGR